MTRPYSKTHGCARGSAKGGERVRSGWATTRRRRAAGRLAALMLLLCTFVSNPVRAEASPVVPKSLQAPQPTSYDAQGTWTQFQLPKGARNVASRQSGAWATASSSAAGFDPNGVIDGNWTMGGWGRGHGWQNAARHHYPSWVEIRLPHEEEIDTIVIQTVPEVMHGINWMAIRDADVQFMLHGKWANIGSQGTIRGNVTGTIVFPIPAMKTNAVRVIVLRANTGNQEDVFYDDDDFARILQIGLYHLQTPYPFTEQALTVHVERGPQGSIAIYRDDLPVKPRNPSSPEFLASLFRGAGYGVTFLDSKALCVSEIFNRKNFDIFVDPYGAPFPVNTMLYQFLSSGGHLITLGGHPFRRALMFTPDGKLVDGGYDPGITTTVARQADYKLPFREQLGLFYAGYEHFQNVSYSQRAPGQDVVQSSFRVTGRLDGEVAAAYVGERLPLADAQRLTDAGSFPAYANDARRSLANIVGVLNQIPSGVNMDYQTGYIFDWPRARWIPLVDSYDRLGNLRGSVISLLTNFRGLYRGSGWIYCGVESEDLFSPRHPHYAQVLLDGLRFLRRDLGLHDVQPELDCYRQGETAKAAATVENYSPVPRQVTLRFQFIPEGLKSPSFQEDVSVMLAPGGTQRPSVSWTPAHYGSDFYTIHVALLEGSQQELDNLDSAFVVWDPRIIAQGPRVDFHHQYFHVGGRSELLIGNRTNGLQPHGQVDEDALAWDRQFAEMREFGLEVASPIFFGIYVPGLVWGRPQRPVVPPQLLRLMDAQVQLAEKHHLIFAPCLFFASKHMAMEQPGLSEQICELIGKRYSSVPGIMFYIFDDGDANVDVQRFHQWTLQCIEGFQRSGRRYMVFGETGGIAMQRYGSEALAFPANGDYSPGHPADFRSMDMRAVGKSFHLSEFGVNSPGAMPNEIDLHTYPGLNVSGSDTGDYSFYLMQPHLFFATGGSYLVNWVSKDPAHLIFPWGVTYANDYTPTKEIFVYRDDSFFLRHFHPQFRLPEVLVVFPKLRLLRDEETFTPYLHGILNTLFEQAVQFAVIDDVDLEQIPPGHHVLIYPDPRYCAPDVMREIQGRVEHGDELFLSGDFTQPEESGGIRQTNWFTVLTGLRLISDYSPNEEIPVRPTGAEGLLNPYIGHPLSSFQPVGATVMAADDRGQVLVSSYSLGQGHVFFTSDSGLDGARRALVAFLKMWAVPSTPFSPKRPDRFILELDRSDGGKVYTLAATHTNDGAFPNNGPFITSPEIYELALGKTRVQLPLGEYGVSLLAARGDGTIDALEGQGKFLANGQTLLDAQPHVMAMTLDDAELDHSQAIAIFAVGAGKISLRVPSDRAVEMGEVGTAGFRPVEQIPATFADGMLTFQIDDVQARGVLLISSEVNRRRARILMSKALQ